MRSQTKCLMKKVSVQASAGGEWSENWKLT
jgi:hypothetical protein